MHVLETLLNKNLTLAFVSLGGRSWDGPSNLCRSSTEISHATFFLSRGCRRRGSCGSTGDSEREEFLAMDRPYVREAKTLDTGSHLYLVFF